jgi:acetyl esterase
MSPELLTARMAEVLDKVARANRLPLYAMCAMGVAGARLAYVAASEVLELPRAALPRVDDLTLPAADGTRLRARLYDPGGPVPPLVLCLHGGGFTIGDPETHDGLYRQFALRSGATVVAVDYRLAPEHRFPTAVDDAWSALQWLAGDGGRALGADPSRIAVAGDSAGGTLAAVRAIPARDAGLPLAALALLTPGTAAHADSASHRIFGSGIPLESDDIDWFFNHFIDRKQRHDWPVAPLEAQELQGVAPACVILAECDPLVDEGVAYADRLRLAHVPVTLEIFRGMTHDLIKMGRVLDEAHAAQAVAAPALRAAFFAP